MRAPILDTTALFGRRHLHPCFNLNDLERMNDSSLFNDEQRTIGSRPPLGEDLLPPVEQPSARFIIQLFVVPALIVVMIVARLAGVQLACAKHGAGAGAADSGYRTRAERSPLAAGP